MKLNETMFSMPLFNTAVAEPSGGGAGSPSGAPASSDGAAPSGQPSGAGSGGSSPSTGGAPASQGGQPSGAPEAEFEVVVDGQKVKVKLSELLSGYSRQSDYTKKTQELAEQRKRYEAELQTYRQEREEWERQRQQPPEGEQDPVQQLQARQDALEKKYADEKMDQVLGELTKKYPLADPKLILLAASEARVKRWEDFDPIAKQLHEQAEGDRNSLIEKFLSNPDDPRMKALEEKIINAYLQRKAKEGKPAHETGSTGAPGGTTGQKPPQSREEERNMALERLRNLNKL